ncbi:growth hormone-inducible transmembrane protein [Aplysia californica]|uniref:Growth hormone-inducible transmembrane protein n=1 Tax=Aplysia californica TaxID=6500 RepID=A0ABM1VTP3_APLCA|nr:growth hormone-inducible transmembrane protein [Aplysia californica]
MDSILKEFSTLVPRDFSYLLPYNNLQDGEGYSAIDVSRGGYVQEPSASPLSSPAQSPNPECVLTDIDNSEGENQVPGSNTAISSDYPALKTPGSCTFESTKGSGLEKETTPSHVTKVQTEVVIPGPSSSKPKSTEKPRLGPDAVTPVSKEELKRLRGREDARKSRLKKKERLETLETMCKEYRATIQIYRKALSIYHQKLTKASALWRSRAMTWYPVVEGTQQFHNPMEIDCMLPTEDFSSKMFASRFAASCGRIPITAFVTGLSRPTLSRPVNPNGLYSRVQMYASETRSGIGRHSKRKSMKETLMAPAGDTAFNMGKGLVAGGAVVGIGALCFYGLGLSSQPGALERSVTWSPVVRQRIRDTYMYFGGSLAITALSAVAAARSPAVMNFMMKNSLLSIGATIAAMIGSGMVCRSIPYREGFGSKQMAWMVHAGIMGAVVAPLTLLGGPLLVRAAWYTAGVVGGLSAVAMCAPSEKFLNMGGILGAGLGVVFVSSLGSAFFPPTTALGAGLYSLSIYGGLVLFSLFLLYDTQRIIKLAEVYPVYAERPFDPVNASISIYIDTINIFIRIAMMLAGQGSRRK